MEFVQVATYCEGQLITKEKQRDDDETTSFCNEDDEKILESEALRNCKCPASHPFFSRLNYMCLKSKSDCPVVKGTAFIQHESEEIITKKETNKQVEVENSESKLRMPGFMQIFSNRISIYPRKDGKNDLIVQFTLRMNSTDRTFAFSQALELTKPIKLVYFINDDKNNEKIKIPLTIVSVLNFNDKRSIPYSFGEVWILVVKHV